MQILQTKIDPVRAMETSLNQHMKLQDSFASPARVGLNQEPSLNSIKVKFNESSEQLQRKR